ncbi:MAG: EscC/YscC/HrcC family type III secretion system outer membrane ring protein, partial [Duodenibacillus sp.]|nr:EscC/YscC/HrcC family type III secretion system outer membrane ring protein [Duodenibacillus sp.]
LRGGSVTRGKWTSGGSIGAANSSGYDKANDPSSAHLPLTASAAGAMLSTIYTNGVDFFMARIAALEEKNAAKMLGRPSVLTVDNVQAVLENTTTYYIPLKGKEAVDLFKVESGTVLRVTPHIIRENGQTSIKLAVSVQDDQNDASAGYQSVGDEGGTTMTVAPIKQTKINTQAVVNVGQSLLIGGYYYEQRKEGTSGVPLLKDIPLIGGLFEFNSKGGRLMERLILITPRLVTPQGMNYPARVNDDRFRQRATQSTYEYVPLPKGK